MNSKNVKTANRQAIFNLVYNRRNISKPEISSTLGISVPTVSQYVNEFKTLGFISDDTFLDSTGGRKAVNVSFISDYRIAIGVEILIDTANLVAINLFGESLAEASYKLPFANTDKYCAILGNYIVNFFINLNVNRNSILGVGLAIQGVVDETNKKVISGDIMNSTGFSTANIQQYVPFPCFLQHDSEASCNYMLWKTPELKNAYYIILNDYFGGILIVNRHIHWGPYAPSGLIAHMTLYPDGKKCYCGKRGCVDTYCSVRILKEAAGTDLDTFFKRVRAGQTHSIEIWHKYLDLLAQTIYNLQIVNSIEIVIGGRLSNYLNKDDIDYIKAQELANTNITTSFPDIHIFRTDAAAAKGSALYYIHEFLKDFYIPNIE